MKHRLEFRKKDDIIKEIEALHKLGVKDFRLGKQSDYYSYPSAIEILKDIREKFNPRTLHIDNVNPVNVKPANVNNVNVNSLLRIYGRVTFMLFPVRLHVISHILPAFFYILFAALIFHEIAYLNYICAVPLYFAHLL